MLKSLPSTIEMQIAGNKAKFDLVLPNGKYSFIINGDEISVTRLIDMSEGKFFIKKTSEDFAKETPPITLPSKESKSIAGFKCKSADITATDHGRTNESKVFYTDELGTNNIYFNTDAKAVKGILLDLDYNTMGFLLHLTATNVKPGRVSNKTFDIPSGYVETTETKLQQLRQTNKKK